MLRQEAYLIGLIEQKLASSKTEADMLFALFFTSKLEAYIKGEVTSDEYSYISSYCEEYKSALSSNGITLSEELENSMKTAENFYENNLKRNNIFINNILTSSNIDKKIVNPDIKLIGGNYSSTADFGSFDKVFIIVAGGFHTEGINSILSVNGISNITIMPSVNFDIEQNDYGTVYRNLAKIQSAALKNTIAMMPFGEMQPEFVISEILLYSIAESVRQNAAFTRADLNKALPETLAQAYKNAYGEDINITVTDIEVSGEKIEFGFDIERNGKKESYTSSTDSNRSVLTDKSGAKSLEYDLAGIADTSAKKSFFDSFKALLGFDGQAQNFDDGVFEAGNQASASPVEDYIVHAENMTITPNSKFYSENVVPYVHDSFDSDLIDAYRIKIRGQLRLFYVEKSLNISERELRSIIRAVLNTQKAITDLPQAIFINSLVSSPHLFESDFEMVEYNGELISRAMIGVNRSMVEGVTVSDNESAYKAITAVGIFHELSHVFTENRSIQFEREQHKRDAQFLKTYLKTESKNWLYREAVKDRSINGEHSFKSLSNNVMLILDSVLTTDSRNISQYLTNDLFRRGTLRQYLVPLTVFLLTLFIMPVASPFSALSFGLSSFGYAGYYIIVAATLGSLAVLNFLSSFINRKTDLSNPPLLRNPVVLLSLIWMGFSLLTNVKMYDPTGHFRDFITPMAMAATILDAKSQVGKMAFGFKQKYKNMTSRFTQRTSSNRIAAFTSILAGGLFGIASELSQKFGWDTLGTYDVLDIFAYIAGTAAALGVMLIYNKYKRFNNYAAVIDFIDSAAREARKSGTQKREELVNIIDNVIAREKRSATNRTEMGEELFDRYIGTLESVRENALFFIFNDIQSEQAYKETLKILKKRLKSFVTRKTAKKKRAFFTAQKKTRQQQQQRQARQRTGQAYQDQRRAAANTYERDYAYSASADAPKQQEQRDFSNAAADAARAAAEAFESRLGALRQFYANEAAAQKTRLTGKNYFIFSPAFKKSDLIKAANLNAYGLSTYVVTVLPSDLSDEELEKDGKTLKKTVNGKDVYFYMAEDANGKFTTLVMLKDIASYADALNELSQNPVLRSDIINNHFGTESREVRRREAAKTFNIDYVDAEKASFVPAGSVGIFSGEQATDTEVRSFDIISAASSIPLQSRLEGALDMKELLQNYAAENIKTFESIYCPVFSDDNENFLALLKDQAANGITSFILIRPTKEQLKKAAILNRNYGYKLDFICDYPFALTESLKNEIINDMLTGSTGYRLRMDTAAGKEVSESALQEFLDELKTEASKINPNAVTGLLNYKSSFSFFTQNPGIHFAKTFSITDNISSTDTDIYPWIDISAGQSDFTAKAENLNAFMRNIAKLRAGFLSIDSALLAGERRNGRPVYAGIASVERTRNLISGRLDTALRITLTNAQRFNASASVAHNTSANNLALSNGLLYLFNDFFAKIYNDKNFDLKKSMVDKYIRDLRGVLRFYGTELARDASVSAFIEDRLEKISATGNYSLKVTFLSEITGLLYGIAENKIAEENPIHRNTLISMYSDFSAMYATAYIENRRLKMVYGDKEFASMLDSSPEMKQMIDDINLLIDARTPKISITAKAYANINMLWSAVNDRTADESTRAAAIAASLYMFDILFDKGYSASVSEKDTQNTNIRVSENILKAA